MKSALRIAVYIILPILTLMLGWQLGVQSQQVQIKNAIAELEYVFDGSAGSGTTITDPEKDVNIAILWSVWRLLQSEYIHPEELQTNKMLYGSVRGLVGSIEDPYTMFMTPKENTDFTDYLDGNLKGIGAELTMRNELVTVVAPLKGSPAKLAGIEPADIIVEVDGVSVVGKSLTEVVSLIRGPIGTDVTLGIAREEQSKLLDITITREEISVPSIEAEVIQHKGSAVGYISINQFGDTTASEVEAEYKQLEAEGISHLILDVRYNGGGYLESSIDIVSMFLSEGKVVTVDRRNQEPLTQFVKGRALNASIPLVVLVNGGSASASEIVAGALKENNRAILIGTKTFGKGTVQEIFSLPGGASVRVTVAKWLTPNGIEINKNGIEPNYTVKQIEEELTDDQEDTDEQLQAALDYLVNGTEPVAVGTGATITN